MKDLNFHMTDQQQFCILHLCCGHSLLLERPTGRNTRGVYLPLTLTFLHVTIIFSLYLSVALTLRLAMW